jgi:hypothetical protein
MAVSKGTPDYMPLRRENHARGALPATPVSVSWRAGTFLKSMHCSFATLQAFTKRFDGSLVWDKASELAATVISHFSNDETRGEKMSFLTDYVASTASGFKALSANGWKLLVLFFAVFAGILASWFWPVAWNFLADESQGLQLGTPLGFAVRVAVSLIAAALTFAPIYSKVENTGLAVAFFIAFQNGFFWESMFKAIQSAI